MLQWSVVKLPHLDRPCVTILAHYFFNPPCSDTSWLYCVDPLRCVVALTNNHISKQVCQGEEWPISRDARTRCSTVHSINSSAFFPRSLFHQKYYEDVPDAPTMSRISLAHSVEVVFVHLYLSRISPRRHRLVGEKNVTRLKRRRAIKRTTKTVCDERRPSLSLERNSNFSHIVRIL